MSTPTHTILITGGTTGLGYACALELARQQPSALILICSRSNVTSADTSINNHLSQKNVQYLPLDLASLSNIRAFAATYSTKHYPPISALILNAALQIPYGITYSADSIEATFAITHVGHALLFYLLKPHLTRTAHIVVVSSGTHDPAQKAPLPDAEYTSAQDLAQPSAESVKKNNGRQRYATSKLCNVLWTYALDRRIKQAGKEWTVVAMDPGLMPGTGLARDTGPVLRFLWHQVLPRVMPVLRVAVNQNIHSPGESGKNLAKLAVGEKDLSEEVRKGGVYVEGTKVINSSVDSKDVGKQDDLWEWTVKRVARDEGEEKAFRKL